MGNRIKTKAAVLVAFVAFLMVATAFAGGIVSPAVHPNSARAVSSSASAGGKMNLLTDLGNGNTLLQGDVGVNLPSAIPSVFTHSPSVLISPISVSPAGPYFVGEPITFSVQGQEGLPPYTYAWNFGNGQSSSGNAVITSFVSAGSYTVTATVFDQALHSASANTTISVLAPLKVTLSPASQSAKTGQYVSVAYSISGGAFNYSLSVSFGDGNSLYISPINSTGGLQTGTLTHRYQYAGSYIIQASVTDSLGDVATALASVSVTTAPLVLAIVAQQAGPYYAGVSYAFQFNVTGGVPGYSFVWNWGDSNHLYRTSYGSSIVRTHSYTSPGLYQIDVNVTDASGQSVGTVLTIKVVQPPLATSIFLNNNTSLFSITESAQQAITTPIQINASVFGGAKPYSWVLFDANGHVWKASTLSSPNQDFHVWTFSNTTPGTYVLDFKATDSLGNVAYASNLVTITIVSSALSMSIKPADHLGSSIPIGSAYTVDYTAYNLQYGTNGYANFTVTMKWGTGITPTVVSQHSHGTPGAFFNYSNSLSFTYAAQGTYTIQGSVNYIGNATVVNSNSFDLTVVPPVPLTVTWGVSATDGQAPFLVNYYVNITGNYTLAGAVPGIFELEINSNSYAYLNPASLGANVTYEVSTPGYAEINNNATHMLANGNYYWNFTYTIVYGHSGQTQTSTSVLETNLPYGDVGSALYNFVVTVDTTPSAPLFAQMFASTQHIEVGQSVSFSASFANGIPPYNYCAYVPHVGFIGSGYVLIPTSAMPIGSLTFGRTGTYTAILSVWDYGGQHYVYDVTIVVEPAMSASIVMNPSSNLMAPVDIAFASQVSGGAGAISYTWALMMNGAWIGNVSNAATLVGMFTQPGDFTMVLNVSDSIGSSANTSVEFTVSASSTIEQVVSARVQATLFTAGGPTYYAYSGPAMWGQDGSLNATFAMPNVPALNAQYTVNVTYGYTVAVTQFVPMNEVFYLFGEYPIGNLSGGSWQTYFYNVYSAQPYASQTLTVVAGGQILSESQLQAGVSTLSTQINGVNTNLSVDTSSLMTALQSGFKTVNSGIVTIQTQGSQIEASLSAINASIKSVGAGVSGLSGSLSTDTATLSTSIGTIQTSLSSLNATVTSVSSTIGAVKGAQVTLSTDVGTLSGDITNVSNGVATIQTTAGQIKVAVGQIQGSANAIQSGMSTVELLLVVLIVLVLITLAVALFSVSRSNALAKKLNGKGKGGSGGVPPAGGSTMFVAVQPYKAPVHKQYRKLK